MHSVRSELLLFPILYYVCGCGVRLEHLKMLRQPFVCLLHGARSLLDYFGEHIVNDMSTEFLVPFIVEARLIWAKTRTDDYNDKLLSFGIRISINLDEWILTSVAPMLAINKAINIFRRCHNGAAEASIMLRAQCWGWRGSKECGINWVSFINGSPESYDKKMKIHLCSSPDIKIRCQRRRTHIFKRI